MRLCRRHSQNFYDVSVYHRLQYATPGDGGSISYPMHDIGSDAVRKAPDWKAPDWKAPDWKASRGDTLALNSVDSEFLAYTICNGVHLAVMGNPMVSNSNSSTSCHALPSSFMRFLTLKEWLLRSF